jgi:YD repeat-containing protein
MDINGNGYVTKYSYSLPNHTTTILQGAQQRVFQTDSVGRTISTSEPERGLTTYGYTYNSTGLVVTRTRPKANQTTATVTTTTTTQYDSLGRPLSVVYNDSLTPSKGFSYDSAGPYWPNGSSATNLKGQLAVMGGSGTGALFSYDLEGHVISMWQCAPSTCGNANSELSRPPISLAYDWVGNLTSEGMG